MRSAFDTRSASFNPDQTAALSAAYHQALRALANDQRVPCSTKSKLAKLIVNLGRERMRQRLELDATEISSKASEFMCQLRTTSPLD